MPDNKQKAEWHPDRYQHDIEVAGQKAAAGSKFLISYYHMDFLICKVKF